MSGADQTRAADEVDDAGEGELEEREEQARGAESAGHRDDSRAGCGVQQVEDRGVHASGLRERQHDGHHVELR